MDSNEDSLEEEINKFIKENKVLHLYVQSNTTLKESIEIIKSAEAPNIVSSIQLCIALSNVNCSGKCMIVQGQKACYYIHGHWNDRRCLYL